jgi:8-oxo-dGTP pyrophosphatase MutT (NUDIX family)
VSDAGADDTAAGDTAADGTVWAAGGVVWRSAPEGEDGRDLQVLVIHRPRYDDWTLPKGKVEAGDADLMATARREVWEETGLRCRLGADLGEVGYTAKGRPKVVHYWSMQAEEGSFAANKEVDEAEWMTPDTARDRLVYPHDVEVVERFLATWV